MIEIISPTLSQSYFSKHYHYLCNICKTVPIIKFSSKGKIKFICNCNDSPKKLNIKNIYDLLYYSEDIDNENILLQCYHNEKYISYCKYCQINLCTKCSNHCINHRHELIDFRSDRQTLNKAKYIITKMNERNSIEAQIII